VPGGRAVSYDFPNGTPTLLKVVFTVFIAKFVTDFAVGLWASGWAPRQPSNCYSYPVRFKGGTCGLPSVSPRAVPGVGFLVSFPSFGNHRLAVLVLREDWPRNTISLK
jgi:hypothetical protein